MPSIRQLRRRRPGGWIELVGGDEDGAHRQERVGALGAEPLAVALLALAQRRRGALPVPGTDVVDDDVAGDVVHRVGAGHATGRATDDDAQLDLEVQGVRALRPHDRVTVPDDRVRELREEQRSRRCLAAAFRGVLAVVETDADDLARSEQDRRRVEPLEWHALLGLGRLPADGILELVVEATGRVERAATDHDLVPVDPAGANGVRAVERDQAHRRAGQLGDAAGAVEPLGAADAGAEGAVLGAAEADGAADPDGAADSRAPGHSSSGFVRSPKIW